MEHDPGTSSAFQESVRLAFAKAKNDILTNLNEINKVREDIISLRKEIQFLKEKNDFLTEKLKNSEELSNMLRNKLFSKEEKYPMVSSGTSSTGNERVLNSSEESLLRQYRLHRPEIAKRRMVELVPETGAVPLFTLYTRLVETDELCGKTTFYRYVKELCDEHALFVFLEHGKRMVRKQLMETVP
ncbi:hypothetical protein HY639_00340 [Candidatus Woesearchaeota archaeon]|nr:hypothetical protein [Candidatus Woesearchaeota archaeon]